MEENKMRYIDKIIIHCSDTKPSMDVGAEEIDRWHKQRGWSKIGYHLVIRKDGTVEEGRNYQEVGAHCKGQNSNSIGICWVGGFGGVDDRTEEQKEALKCEILNLIHIFGRLEVCGHNEFSSKSCPNFDVRSEYNDI